jgi:hypothetical protein
MSGRRHFSTPGKINLQIHCASIPGFEDFRAEPVKKKPQA